MDAAAGEQRPSGGWMKPRSRTMRRKAHRERSEQKAERARGPVAERSVSEATRRADEEGRRR